MLDQITPLVLTYNEAPNIERTLSRLTWAKRIVVIDSFSTDATSDIVKCFAPAIVIQRKFDSHAAQWNFGLQQIQTPWVLSLDADFVLSQEFIEEVKNLSANGEADGFSAPIKYCIWGNPLRRSLCPPHVVLFRTDKAGFHDEGHTQRVQVQGRLRSLRSVIFHDDRKPIDRWLVDQNRYMIKEAHFLSTTPTDRLNWPDRIRRHIVFAPALMFAYALVGKGLIFDGWPGCYYVFQRTLAETLLSLRLLELKLGTEAHFTPTEHQPK
jgi:glycosyltransferase involved in cell wall biosynthesis